MITSLCEWQTAVVALTSSTAFGLQPYNSEDVTAAISYGTSMQRDLFLFPGSSIWVFTVIASNADILHVIIYLTKSLSALTICLLNMVHM